MKSLVLIDGNAIIHRAYHSIPKNFTSQKGELTNAVYGFALTLIRVLEDLHPEYIICSFDLPGPTFRHEKFKAYKATRVKADQELYDQIPRIKELVMALGITIIEEPGFEADDIIGTTVKKIRDHELQNGNEISTYIITGDKDTYQLVNGNVFIYDLKKGSGQPRIIDRKRIKEEYDLEPEDFIDLKALSGDASDNIPGIPGIGDKTATMLLKKFKTLDGIYKVIEESQLQNQESFIVSSSGGQRHDPGIQVDKKPLDSRLRGNDKVKPEDDSIRDIKPRILELLIKYKDQAFLSRELATIHCDVPLKFKLSDVNWGEYDKEVLRKLFEELGFRSLINRFGNNADQNKSKTKAAEEIKKKDQQLKLL